MNEEGEYNSFLYITFKVPNQREDKIGETTISLSYYVMSFWYIFKIYIGIWNCDLQEYRT